MRKITIVTRDRTVGLLDDASMIERIFEHVDRHTTDLSEHTWREPVAHYRSVDRLRREIDVMRRNPVPFCPSAALPEPGSYVARDAAAVPIVAARGHDGVVRAFRNACRHRGTSIASGNGSAASFVCPFHGWVYRLDGALRHVPDEYGFPGLEKSQRGLVAVQAIERGGLVWVDQDGQHAQASQLDALPELIGTGQRHIASSANVVEANWKVLVEGFLEGYHIKATHRETFLPFGYDNLNVIETHGRHSRVTFPFRRIEELRDVPADERRLDGTVTVVDHLFPNVVVARLSHHTMVVVLEPLAIDRTTLVNYQLTNRSSSGGTNSTSDASRDADFVRLGTDQDLEVARAVQRGLASGANETLEFGRFEGAISHFHRQLSELLDATPVSEARSSASSGRSPAEPELS